MATSADLESAIVASPANAAVGADTNLNITLANNGPATAVTNSVRATLPPGLTFKSATGGTFDAGSNTVTFSLASLASGASKAYTIVATVEQTGSLGTTVNATSVTPDSELANNHATAVNDAIFASTGNWVIRKILDNLTPVPDRAGDNFKIGGGLDPLPVLDGDKVAFISFDGSNLPSIWSADADGSGNFTRLVDTDDNVPAGASEKFGYMKNLRLRNGEVAFLGYGADGLHDGIYTIPASGGTLKSVVGSGSPRPEGSGANFGYQDFIQSFSYGYLADGRICFVAGTGLYAYPLAGGVASVVVYPGSNIPVAGNASVVFSTGPAISGNRVVWEATGSGDALLESFLDQRHFAALADIATASPSTPGENFVYSTQFSFANAQVEGETVVFRAFSGAGASIRGLYSITGHGPAVKLVDTNTDVPGGTGKFTGFTFQGSPDTFALSDGEVVFQGTDEDNRAGLYAVSVTGGPITKIVAIGDTVGNLQITGTPAFFQPNSLGQHQLAFQATFFDTTTSVTNTGLFVAGRVMNRLANISTRLNVGTVDNVLIGGVIISGSSPKTVLVRGIGPSLTPFGVPDALADPTLELLGSAGSLVSNDNWRDSHEQEIMDTGLQPTNDLESAIVATLDPGSYTAILRGKNSTTGNGLVEVYDLEPSTELDTRLANISTRGFVQSGDSVMIGGVIIQGAAEKHLLIRAIGPSLADFGVPNVLLDPTLDVVDSMGVTVSNDNWRDSQEAVIASSIPPNDNRESAIDIYLMPGNYTAIVRGKNNTTGNALVEVYELP